MQKSKPGRLGEILVSLKAVPEESVARALCDQLGLTYLDEVAVEKVDPDLVKDIPINFAKQFFVLPIERVDGSCRVLVADPLDLAALDGVAAILKARVGAVVSTKQKVTDAINAVYDKRARQAESVMDDLEEANLDDIAHELEEPEDLLDASDEAPIIRLVNSLFAQAVKERASDIHIEPFEKEIVVRFRIDGVLYEIIKPPKRFQASIISRVKIMAGLNIAEKRLPQDGRIRIKIAGKDIDVRVSVIPTAHGERVVMRLLDKTGVLLNMSDLGLMDEKLSGMRELIHKSHGIILVTGPTGSGKTTTLYAALTEINSPDLNILTVEDPIEYQIKGIGQMQVSPKIGLTFATGLRSFLRQDPDVILVGEIRDLETAEIAIQASLTGHLVFSTLHTNDSATSLTRLVDMGVQPFLVASSLVGILAQRLVRTVCPECREPYVPSDAEIGQIGLRRETIPRPGFIYRPKGCPKCLSTGYTGRSGIYEMMLIDEEIQALILKNADSNTIKRAAQAKGMLTLREDGAQKVSRGMTTIEEVMRVTQEDIQ
ncbi:MAG: type II secretion system ATPase GspE [Deltaproteobacteria bacterium]|nr:type II secretion system ATPase GspE [Deltaproteobacteria bacterium]